MRAMTRRQRPGRMLRRLLPLRRRRCGTPTAAPAAGQQALLASRLAGGGPSAWPRSMGRASCGAS
jgi:hypothetical protein